ncbi:MAG: 4Fe-4S dicluster domain-containing protein [bacterium]|nr:4Fe-4S dicluster domain-containing protein [bacterium]
MPNTNLYYDSLHKALNRFDLKVPKSKKFTELLKLLYSPEEAKLLSHFGSPYIYTEHAEKTSKKTDRPVEEVEEIFNNMVTKGTLFTQKNEKGETMYSLPPFIPGIYEFYTMSENDPYEKKKEILKLLDEYFFETFVPEAYNASEYPWFRVLPANDSVTKLIDIDSTVEPVETKILPFELASEYIRTAEYIAVGDCACRIHAEMQDGKKRCDKPIDVCLVFDRVAEYWAEKGIGRLISHEEADTVLQRSAEAGLVHCTTNNQVFGNKMSGMICNCCPCCCFILQGVLKSKGRQQGLAKSNFHPVIKKDDCNLCGKCLSACPVDALYHHKPHLEDNSDNFIALKTHGCIGCGICSMACPKDTIKMKKTGNTVPEPDVFHLGIRHNAERTH